MKHKITAEKIFFSVAIFNICIVYILLIASKGQFIYALTYDESNFCDFWNHVKRLLFEQHIYTSDADAIFPPLAYLFLKMFAYPLKYKAEAGDDFWSISQHGYGTLMVVMYLLLFAWLLMIAVHIYYKTGSYVKESALLGILFFSYLIWGFAFERGNLVLYTTVFLMFGLALRDSPNKILREISLIMVAVAAGFKLYPALFGFVWIAEKRYKEAVRMVAYGLAAFFIPFLFVDRFTNYLRTFIQYLDKKSYSHASVWGVVLNTFGDGRYTQMLCRGIVVAIILWALYVMFADGINWKTLTLLTATQTMIIPEQYVYTYVFVMIPLICFLNEAGKRRIDYLYAFLFAALFTMPPILRGGAEAGRLFGYGC
ncbi:MAG: DUF2029 domain-containing protein [Lachnospiraceae bacterium]|nr:DUF2029 domain-containing protein [Lachnospiraceae bacterium]